MCTMQLRRDKRKRANYSDSELAFAFKHNGNAALGDERMQWSVDYNHRRNEYSPVLRDFMIIDEGAETCLFGSTSE